MSLSPETLELVARGLGLNSLSFLRMDHIEESIYTDFPDNTVAYSLPDLAAACKAKLRERGLGYDCWANTSGYLGARIYKNGDVPYIYQPSQDGTDDEALISCFAQAVAKGALP
jgi:hypothetical protein